MNKEQLKEYLTTGSTLVVNVMRKGNTHKWLLKIAIIDDNNLINITELVSEILELKLTSDLKIINKSMGMNVVFYTLYELSKKLGFDFDESTKIANNGFIF